MHIDEIEPCIDEVLLVCVYMCASQSSHALSRTCSHALVPPQVRVNPAGALEFAQKLVQAEGVTLDYGVVTDVFMQHNCLQQVAYCTLPVG